MLNFFRLPAPTLSLKKFDLDQETRTLLISGRVSGIAGFLLDLLRMSPTTSFALMPDRIELDSATINSQSKTVFPLAATDSTACGYRRQSSYLVIAAVLFIMGLSALLSEDGEPVIAFLMLVFSALLVIAFVLSRKIFIAVYCGSVAMMLVFKESTIGGKKINRKTAMKVIDVINNRIVDARNV